MRDKNISPTPHDSFWKANLNDPKKAKKLIETHLSKEIVKHTDFTTLEAKPTEFIQHNLRLIVSDVLYSVKIKGKPAYIYFLWEHMSTAEALMAFRMLLYVAEIMKWHLAQGNNKLPLVIPCVIYHGKQYLRQNSDKSNKHRITFNYGDKMHKSVTTHWKNYISWINDDFM